MKTNFFLGETKEYDKFNFREANRDLNTSNVNKIVKSIEEIGLQCPIIVNEEYEIIDGQHRFVALRQLSRVVPYVISKRWQGDDTIAQLQESRKWTALDFAESLAKRGDISCKTALELADDWYEYTNKKLTKIRSLELLMDGRRYTGVQNYLKKKEYVINSDIASEIVNVLSEMIISNDDNESSIFAVRMVRAIKLFYYDNKKFDVDVFKEMSKQKMLKVYGSESEQLDYLTKLYNRFQTIVNKRKRSKALK